MSKKRKKPTANPQKSNRQTFIQEMPILRLRKNAPVKKVQIGEAMIIYEEQFPDILAIAKHAGVTDETFLDVTKGLCFTAINALFLDRIGVEHSLITNSIEQSLIFLTELDNLSPEQLQAARVLFADGMNFKEAIATSKLL